VTTILLSALAGAGGLGALLAPVLVWLSARRNTQHAERMGMIDQLQQERDAAVRRADQRDATCVELWDYVLSLRYWLVKGSAGNPPTLPDTLSVAAVRARMVAPTPIPTPRGVSA